MRLRLREGAIVEFLINGGYREDDTFVGKVMDVKEDEVIIRRQTGVIQWPSDDLDGTYYPEYDPPLKRKEFVSIDIGPLIHINRYAILGWWYVRTDRFKNHIEFDGQGKEKNYWKEKTIKDYTVNHYDESGYCKGNGKDFSND